LSIPWFNAVATLIRAHPSYSRLGFLPEELAVYDKGADHNPLMQIGRTTSDPGWRVWAEEGEHAGYEGVWFHFESCRPGHLVLHCEFCRRQGKMSKDAIRKTPPMLELKRGLTEEVRRFGKELGWPEKLGAHLKRAREDSGDPSSLIVWTFDLGLDQDCAPEQFVQRAMPVIEAVTPVIDTVTGHKQVKDRPRTRPSVKSILLAGSLVVVAIAAVAWIVLK
jgi:hypothetical protein